MLLQIMQFSGAYGIRVRVRFKSGGSAWLRFWFSPLFLESVGWHNAFPEAFPRCAKVLEVAVKIVNHTYGVKGPATISDLVIRPERVYVGHRPDRLLSACPQELGSRE